MGKDEDRMLGFLDGTRARVVMESGYNHQHIYDVLKEEGYSVTNEPVVTLFALYHYTSVTTIRLVTTSKLIQALRLDELKANSILELNNDSSLKVMLYNRFLSLRP